MIKQILDRVLLIKNIDWIPFLTTRLIDDLASHIRLFKKAKFAEKTQEGNGSKIVDLESLFFDAKADFLSSKNDDWSLEVYVLHKRENSGLFF